MTKDIPYKDITDEAIQEWCIGAFGDYTFDRLKEIIKGEYPLDEAREDAYSFMRIDKEPK